MISSPQFLFSLPVFIKRLIAGRKIQIDNQVLNVDSQLLLNQYYKILGGKISNSTPENPVYDISHWERALNGNAIRIMHSVNNGEYGGESIVMWDTKKESLVSWYFTTAGFYTQATLHFEDEKLISIEDVTGNENGITQVKAIIEFLPDGELLNSAKYFMNGNWVDGHKIYYMEAPDAEVVLK